MGARRPLARDFAQRASRRRVGVITPRWSRCPSDRRGRVTSTRRPGRLQSPPARRRAGRKARAPVAPRGSDA